MIHAQRQVSPSENPSHHPRRQPSATSPGGNRRLICKFTSDSKMIYDCPQPTPIIFNLNVHFTRVSDLVGRDNLVVDPPVAMAGYRDGFGNWGARIVAPKGRTRVWAESRAHAT